MKLLVAVVLPVTVGVEYPTPESVRSAKLPVSAVLGAGWVVPGVLLPPPPQLLSVSTVSNGNATSATAAQRLKMLQPG